MKKLLVLLLASVLVGCGNSGGGSSSPPPVSLLSDKNVYYSGATLYLSSSGTFIYSQTSPTSCTEAGTWQDMNPGSANGQIQFVNTSNTCTVYAKSLDSYILSNGELLLTLISH
jgi:hypothetical protein